MGVFIILVWLVCGLAAGTIASNNGRSGCGWFILGVLFGPLALLFVMVAGTDSGFAERDAIRNGERRRCPFCAEPIQFEASLCPHCRSAVTPQDPPKPPIPLIAYLLAFFVVIFGLSMCVADAPTPASTETLTSTVDRAAPSNLPAAFAGKTGPAPTGSPWTVAKAEIDRAGHACGTVSSVERDTTGAIQAKCANGKAYLIFSVKGSNAAVAMDCAAASKFISEPACPWAG